MAVFVALLRGVNVGGNTLKMERLRKLAAELGFRDARTYVQSGNLVFRATGSAKSIATKLERKLAGETRLPVSILVLSAADLQKLLTSNPFLKDKKVDRARLYATIVDQKPNAEGERRLAEIKAGADQFRVMGNVVYLHCPGGYGNTKLSNTAVERAFSVRATTRNWNTINTLCEMVAE